MQIEDNRKLNEFENDCLKMVEDFFAHEPHQMNDVWTDPRILNRIIYRIKKNRLKGFGLGVYKDNASYVKAFIQK